MMLPVVSSFLVVDAAAYRHLSRRRQGKRRAKAGQRAVLDVDGFPDTQFYDGYPGSIIGLDPHVPAIERKSPRRMNPGGHNLPTVQPGGPRTPASRLPLVAGPRLHHRAARRGLPRRAGAARDHRRLGHLRIELSRARLLEPGRVLDGADLDHGPGQRDPRHRVGRAERRHHRRVRGRRLYRPGRPVGQPDLGAAQGDLFTEPYESGKS
jgi:hypothetical protein